MKPFEYIKYRNADSGLPAYVRGEHKKSKKDTHTDIANYTGLNLGIVSTGLYSIFIAL